MNIFNIGPMELLMILVIVLIVFGPNKIPEIGASIGKMVRQFREASREITAELNLEDLNPSEEPAGDRAAQPALTTADPVAPAADAPMTPTWEQTPEGGPPAAEAAPLLPTSPPPNAEPPAPTTQPALPPAPQPRRFLVSRERWQKPAEEDVPHGERT